VLRKPDNKLMASHHLVDLIDKEVRIFEKIRISSWIWNKHCIECPNKSKVLHRMQFKLSSVVSVSQHYKITTRLVGLVQSEWLIIISFKINLFSPWHSWKIDELALNNNHALIDSWHSCIVRYVTVRKNIF